MEINDKRKFTPEGDVIEREPETISETVNRILLAEIPCIYDDPRPIKNYLLVRQHAKETTYAGTKYIIPETAQQSPNKGVVVSIGPDVAECAPGDIVTFGRFNAEPIDIDGDTFQLVNSNDLKLVEKVTYAVNA